MADQQTGDEGRRRANTRIQHLLDRGLRVSMVLIGAGLLWAMATGEQSSVPVRLGSLLADGSSADRLIATGLLALCFTPVARVVALIVIWSRQHDLRFALTGVAVLVVLAAGIALGHA
jgi:uncharacterized membrane protein